MILYTRCALLLLVVTVVRDERERAKSPRSGESTVEGFSYVYFSQLVPGRVMSVGWVLLGGDRVSRRSSAAVEDSYGATRGGRSGKPSQGKKQLEELWWG